MPGAKNWCFTINADEESSDSLDWPAATEVNPPLAGWTERAVELSIVYLAYQVESGVKSGHMHLQGSVCFAERTTLANLKKLNARAHWEVMRGTPKQASDYCKKTDTRLNGPFTFGELPAGQGSRTDLKQIYTAVKARNSNLDLLEQSGGTAAKFEKCIKFMRFTLMEGESDRQLQGVRIITLYGNTGTGKTYAAINYIANGKDYYICEAPSHESSKVWFDGYEGQKTLILDDFAGSFCAFRYLLRLLDKYKLKIEVKGAFAWAVWTTVVITTNCHPAAWYDGVDAAPLRRRLCEAGSEIRYVENQGTYKVMDWTERIVTPDFIAFQLPPPIVPMPVHHTQTPDLAIAGSMFTDDADFEKDLVAAVDQACGIPETPPHLLRTVSPTQPLTPQARPAGYSMASPQLGLPESEEEEDPIVFTPEPARPALQNPKPRPGYMRIGF